VWERLHVHGRRGFQAVRARRRNFTDSYPLKNCDLVESTLLAAWWKITHVIMFLFFYTIDSTAVPFFPIQKLAQFFLIVFHKVKFRTF
jgi:hypothetical protein